MQGFAKQRGIRVSILTGDVHLACYGQVRRLKGYRQGPVSTPTVQSCNRMSIAPRLLRADGEAGGDRQVHADPPDPSLSRWMPFPSPSMGSSTSFPPSFPVTIPTGDFLCSPRLLRAGLESRLACLPILCALS